jgi:hypothetical protein
MEGELRKEFKYPIIYRNVIGEAVLEHINQKGIDLNNLSPQVIKEFMLKIKEIYGENASMYADDSFKEKVKSLLVKNIDDSLRKDPINPQIGSIVEAVLESKDPFFIRSLNDLRIIDYAGDNRR